MNDTQKKEVKIYHKARNYVMTYNEFEKIPNKDTKEYILFFG